MRLAQRGRLCLFAVVDPLPQTLFSSPVGLVYVVVAWQKDVSVNSNNELMTRSGAPLGVSSVVVPVLTSETPDAAFNELTSVTFADAGASFTFPLTGYARLPTSALGANAEGLSLGPIALFTAKGNLLLLGTTLAPMDGAVAAFVAYIAAEAAAIGTAAHRRRALLGNFSGPQPEAYTQGGRHLMGVSGNASASGGSGVQPDAYTQGGRHLSAVNGSGMQPDAYTQGGRHLSGINGSGIQPDAYTQGGRHLSSVNGSAMQPDAYTQGGRHLSGFNGSGMQPEAYTQGGRHLSGVNGSGMQPDAYTQGGRHLLAYASAWSFRSCSASSSSTPRPAAYTQGG